MQNIHFVIFLSPAKLPGVYPGTGQRFKRPSRAARLPLWQPRRFPNWRHGHCPSAKKTRIASNHTWKKEAEEEKKNIREKQAKLSFEEWGRSFCVEFLGDGWCHTIASCQMLSKSCPWHRSETGSRSCSRSWSERSSARLSQLSFE